MTYLATPFDTLNQFNRNFGPLFDDRLLRRSNGRGLRATDLNDNRWSPSIDIVEAEDKFVVYADVPGIPRDAIEISVHRGVLTIKGERTASNDENVTHRERIRGAFSRAFNLPESADEDAVTARVDNGVLEIEIPKAVEAKPVSISIAGE